MKEDLKAYGEVLTDVDLKKYNTYGIGGRAAFLIKPYKIDDVLNLIKYLKKNNYAFYILGGGSNVILPDTDFKGIIIKLDYLNNFVIKNNKIEVEAGITISKLVQETLKESFVNFAFLFGIPGTLGGAIRGNAGCFKHEIFDYLEDITIIDEDNKISVLKKKDIKYGYRYSEFKTRNIIILKATLKLELGDVKKAKQEIKEHQEYRKNTQPIDAKNAGSVFKNPEGLSAGKLIDEASLKGFRVNDAMVSEKHANFIINTHKATSSDIIKLINIIKKKVKEENNIDLELEQVIVKW